MKPTNKSKSSIDQRAKAKTPNNLSQQQHQHPLLTHMTYAYSAVHFGHHTMQHPTPAPFSTTYKHFGGRSHGHLCQNLIYNYCEFNLWSLTCCSSRNTHTHTHIETRKPHWKGGWMGGWVFEGGWKSGRWVAASYCIYSSFQTSTPSCCRLSGIVCKLQLFQKFFSPLHWEN